MRKQNISKIHCANYNRIYIKKTGITVNKKVSFYIYIDFVQCYKWLFQMSKRVASSQN